MGLVILCYHKVGPLQEEGRRLNVEPATLQKHISYFKRRGFTFVLPRDLVSPWPRRGICFTFDDGFATTLERATTIFLDHGVRCAFYAVAGHVGTTSAWEGVRASPLASWEALTGAHSNGFEIGSHALEHTLLNEMSPEEQMSQLTLARAEFEAKGLEPISICYPNGAWSAATIRAAAETGHKVGLALGKRPASLERDHILALPRITVSYSDGIAMLLYKIHVRPRLPRASQAMLL